MAQSFRLRSGVTPDPVGPASRRDRFT